MATTRRQFVWNSVGLAGASAFSPMFAQLLSSSGSSTGSETGKPYGSGYFGEWIEDEFGLPAFRYTCDQTKDPKAVTPVSPGILTSMEHVHQVGNDRITAIVSNYGHVRVRQDEGSPKFLNDYVPETNQFGGGLGYLTDGQETLNTFYNGDNAHFERIFGVGYFRKKVGGENYSIDQVIAAPFGDDPVLRSQVTITNYSKFPAKLHWIEYWGCQPYQFSFRSWIEGWAGTNMAELRRQFARRFSHQIQKTDGNYGLLESKKFLGRTPQEDGLWQKMKASLSGHPNQFVAPIGNAKPGTDFDDLNPRNSFLLSLDAPADGFSADGKAFFGAGGAAAPSGLLQRLNGRLENSDSHSALLLERTLELNPGEKRTLHFLYGYLTEGFELDALVERYRKSAPTAWKQSSEKWKSAGIKFSVDSEPWVNRETTWNHYYLRSSMTYDDFFQEHILNQNGFYQYVMGFQGAARDPLQHCLPFIFSDPEIVKNVLRYTLKEVRPNGSVPYGVVGHGVVAPLVTDNSCDMPLWLLWAVSEYILATRDVAFLDETIALPYSESAGVAQKENVRNLLMRCYQHQVKDVGLGEHGISRMLNDDWNDGLLAIWASKVFDECAKQGESVLNSAMSAWVFDFYARMLSYVGENSGQIATIRQSADIHRHAAQKQWTGKWLRRAWLGPTLGWVGEKNLWIEPQPWAIVGRITTPEQNRTLVQAINELLRKGPIGAAQLSEGPDMMQGGIFEAGTSTNGGVWPSLNQTLVWALAQVDPAMAWDEWKKNSLARHAEEYPDVWYGVLSGPDTYNSTFSKWPGETVHSFGSRDFPVLNLHSHACYLYSAAKLLGIEFTEAGINLIPGLPVESYRFESPLIGIIKSGKQYEGWYAPSCVGEWTLQITLPRENASKIFHAEINETPVEVKKSSDGVVELKGLSGAQKPLRWRLS